MTNANPASAVDISAIQESMKAHSLDQYRGYAQNHYTEVKQTHPTEYLTEEMANGVQVLRDPLWNKGETSCSSLMLVNTDFLQVSPSPLLRERARTCLACCPIPWRA